MVDPAVRFVEQQIAGTQGLQVYCDRSSGSRLLTGCTLDLVTELLVHTHYETGAIRSVDEVRTAETVRVADELKGVCAKLLTERIRLSALLRSLPGCLCLTFCFFTRFLRQSRLFC